MGQRDPPRVSGQRCLSYTRGTITHRQWSCTRGTISFQVRSEVHWEPEEKRMLYWDGTTSASDAFLELWKQKFPFAWWNEQKCNIISRVWPNSRIFQPKPRTHHLMGRRRRATSCNRNHHTCSTSSALLCSPDLYHKRLLMLCCFLFLLRSPAQQGLLRILMLNNVFDLFITPAFGWFSC